MNHRWLGLHPVSIKVIGGETVQVGPGDFVDADMDDPHVIDYFDQGLLLPVEVSSSKAPKDGV